jgi:hypothetical protein
MAWKIVSTESSVYVRINLLEPPQLSPYVYSKIHRTSARRMWYWKTLYSAHIILCLINFHVIRFLDILIVSPVPLLPVLQNDCLSFYRTFFPPHTFFILSLFISNHPFFFFLSVALAFFLPILRSPLSYFTSTFIYFNFRCVVIRR